MGAQIDRSVALPRLSSHPPQGRPARLTEKDGFRRAMASGMVDIFEALSSSVWVEKAPGASSWRFRVSTAGLAFTLLEAAQIALPDHSLRFDFDQIVANQPAELPASYWPGEPDAKASAVRAGDRLPLICIREIDAGAHDVVEAGAQRSQARGDLVEDERRLSCRDRRDRRLRRRRWSRSCR